MDATSQRDELIFDSAGSREVDILVTSPPQDLSELVRWSACSVQYVVIWDDVIFMRNGTFSIIS